MTDATVRQQGVRIFDRWTSMWNRDLALAEQIMAPEFVLRYAQAEGALFDTIRRPADLASIIAAWHQKRRDIVFRAEGEAVVDLTREEDGLAGLVARPYLASYTGDDGQVIARSGTDILRITAGLISEVWSVSSGVAGRTFYPG